MKIVIATAGGQHYVEVADRREPPYGYRVVDGAGFINPGKNFVAFIESYERGHHPWVYFAKVDSESGELEAWRNESRMEYQKARVVQVIV